MDRGVQKSRDYFSKRAERYALALRQMPHARILDLFPYLYAFSELSKDMAKPISDLEVMDAFGGTGFLSHSLMNSGMHFTVGDACSEMLSLGDSIFKNVYYREVVDNFESLAERSPRSQDCVVCHGGLHHVVVEDDGIVDDTASKTLQKETVANLAKLVRPGGLLIVADVAAIHSDATYKGNPSSFSGPERVRKLLSSTQLKVLKDLGLDYEVLSLEALALEIRDRFISKVGFPVPRYFFDEYVAKQTELGHSASFLMRDELVDMGSSAGMYEQWAVEFFAPWLFSSRNHAGWYFREKFSCGHSSPPGMDVSSEMQMAEHLEKYLGTRDLGEAGFAVNWGVNYVCLKKPC